MSAPVALLIVNSEIVFEDWLETYTNELFAQVFEMTAAPGLTVKPLLSIAMSAPVVRVIVRGPIAVIGSIFTRAVALVAEVIVSEVTVIPVPKFAVVVPCRKCVFRPIRTTERFCSPCSPALGATDDIYGTSTGATETFTSEVLLN